MAFDTLKFAKRLKEAGFTEQQAEALAEAEAELFETYLATKQDIAEVWREIVEVQRRIEGVRAAISSATSKSFGAELSATSKGSKGNSSAILRT